MRHNEIKSFLSKDRTKKVKINIWAIKMFELAVTELALANNLAAEFKCPADIYGVNGLLEDLPERDPRIKLIKNFDLDFDTAKSLIADVVCSFPKEDKAARKEIKKFTEKYLKTYFSIIKFSSHSDIIRVSAETEKILEKTYKK
jgi:hypothetical protein